MTYVSVNDPMRPGCEFKANGKPCQYPLCECGYGPGRREAEAARAYRTVGELPADTATPRRVDDSA